MARLKDHDGDKLRALRAENRSLKHEIKVLRLELEERNGFFDISTEENDFHARLKQHAHNERVFSRKRYSAYVWDQIRQTPLFQLYSRVIHAIRRYTFWRTTFRVVLAIVTAIQSGALFLLFASFFLVSIPLTLVISHATLILTFLFGRRIHSVNQSRMREKEIVVFFPPKKNALRKDSFFNGMVREEASKKNRFCVIVSPYFWSAKGLDGTKKKPYLASRLERENILIVRRHYYFTIKKRIFATSQAHITEIY